MAEYEEQLAREQVASGTALVYLEALRSGRAVGAAQADVELAEALVKLAEDQRAPSQSPELVRVGKRNTSSYPKIFCGELLEEITDDPHKAAQK